jgi:hypothetical protein
VDEGQVALIPVTYLEDRHGRALVRLPNGSKTSVQPEALSPLQARGHFIRATPGGRVLCLYDRNECSWTTDFEQWHDGVEALARHWAEAHLSSSRRPE